MLLPDIAVASYASSLKGAQRVLEAAGYQILVMNTEREPERESAALRTLYARHVDGVLVAVRRLAAEGVAEVFVPAADAEEAARAAREATEQAESAATPGGVPRAIGPGEPPTPEAP
jgi:cell division septum initiation protein DivIVA